MKKRLILGIWLLIIASFAGISMSISANTGSAPEMARAIDKLIQNHLLSHIPLGIMVQDAKSGEILYQQQETTPLIPASTLKLLTAAAALFELGPDYQFKTGVFRNTGGNITVQFSGDPSFKVEDLKKMIQVLKQANINVITGNLVIDNTRFQDPSHAWGWSWNSLVWGFAAPITTVILNENKTQITITPSPTLKDKAIIRFAENEALTFPLDQDVTTVTDLESREICEIRITLDDNNRIKARGCWPQPKLKTSNPEPITLNLAIANPDEALKTEILKLLKEENLQLKGKIIFGSLSNDATEIYTHSSEPLQRLIKPLLEDSNNVYAESFLKTLGFTNFQLGTFQSGVRALLTSLQNHLSINPKEMQLWDGSGQSRYNLIMPKHLARALFVIYHHPEFSMMVKGVLPRSGESGTLKERMKDTALKGKVLAKTGGVFNTTSLAGYITTQKNRDLIFVIMANNMLNDHSDARAFEDALCGYLYNNY